MKEEKGVFRDSRELQRWGIGSTKAPYSKRL